MHSLTHQRNNCPAHPDYSKDSLHAITFPTRFRDIACFFLCLFWSRDEILPSLFPVQLFSAQVIFCFLNTFLSTLHPASSHCLVISERPAFLHPFLAFLLFHLDELKRTYLWITSRRAVLVIHL